MKVDHNEVFKQSPLIIGLLKKYNKVSMNLLILQNHID